MSAFKRILNSIMTETTYVKKKKELIIVCKSKDIAKLFEIVGGKNVSRSGRNVTVDVSKIKDVEQALSMIEIAAKVK